MSSFTATNAGEKETNFLWLSVGLLITPAGNFPAGFR